MEDIWKIFRESLPEAIGGISVIIIVGIASFIWTRIRKYQKSPMFDVYLSYPVVDRPIVKQFATTLENFGVKVFYDQKLKPGEKFQKVLDRELSRVPAIGFCITPATQRAQGVLDEISKALGREEGTTTLIPIVMPGATIADIPDRLKGFMAVNFGGGFDDQEITKLVERLGRS